MFKINRDPDPVEDQEGASLEDAVNYNLGAEEKTDEEKAAETKAAEEKAAAEATPEVDIEGYKGKDRRGKAYEGDKRRKGEDDPDVDVGFEHEEGKGTKLKLSEVKNSLKWLFDNSKTIAGSMKIREQALANPAFHKLMSTLIEKSFGEDNKFNAEFATKAQTALEAKEEKIEETIEDKDEEIEKAEALLKSEDIDPDSIQAQVLKGNIAAMKNQRMQLKDALGKIEDISKKLAGIEDGQSQAKSQQEKDTKAGEDQRISGVFAKEIASLTDKDKQDGYKFSDEDESKEFEALVRKSVADNAKGIKTDDDFLKVIRASAKEVSDKLAQRREKIVNDYIKSKGGKITPEKKKEKEQEESNEDMDVGTLSDSIEKMLKEKNE